MTANKIIEKYSPNMKEADLVPTIEDFVHIIESKRGYEQSYGTPQGAAWQKKNFFKTPWGISWNVSPRGKAPNESKALRYYLVAELIGWAELITNLKRTVGQSYKWSKKDIETVANSVWKKNITDIQPFDPELAKYCYQSVNISWIFHNILTCVTPSDKIYSIKGGYIFHERQKNFTAGYSWICCYSGMANQCHFIVVPSCSRYFLFDKSLYITFWF